MMAALVVLVYVDDVTHTSSYYFFFLSLCFPRTYIHLCPSFGFGLFSGWQFQSNM